MDQLPRTPKVVRWTVFSLQRDTNILQYSHVREDSRDLKGASDTSPSQLCGTHIRDVPPVEQNLAAGRLQKLGEQIEQGCLTGSIGTDQGVNYPLPDPQADVVDSNEAAE